jgi:hypothetical protein
MTDMEALTRQIADDLIGTCNSLAVALEHRDADGVENDITFCAALDSLVFCCEGCDWWCGIEELNNDTGNERCDDCNDENNDD